LDAELVRRGLAPSRAQAQALLAAAAVTVSGAPTTKADRLVDPGEPIEVAGPPPRFVSRGGEKLDAALDAFAIDPAGRRCLDVGASTGGFSDCLLQRGAAHVWAVDVGRNQLHERLRADARVTARDGWHARDLTPARTGGRFDLVVADLSFISLRPLAATLVAMAAPGADLVVLVKPQFEAGRAEAAKGKGVIRDPAVRARVVDDVTEAFAAGGAITGGTITSPITGGDGNVEFLLWATAPAHPGEQGSG
jgi:23S rRNA (cytidine1920-2'-O)/16S rRNA (cytidine1409-2'-O)-methyltransferase